MAESMRKNSPVPQNLVIKYYLIILLIIGVLIFGAVTLFYNIQTKNDLTEIEMREYFSIELLEQNMLNNFKTIVSDLKFLLHQNELQQMLESGDKKIKQIIAQEYLEFSKKKKIYDQIRFLDERGDEVVRVNYNNGIPTVVPDGRLQQKANRYYFKDIFNLQRGFVFLSPFDLNVERGKIEYPLKPIIRFGAPVFDNKGEKRGIIVLNYYGANLIATLKKASQFFPGDIMLVNSDGYWLVGPKPESEWGFMIPENADQKFSNTYAKAWHHITNAEKDQIYSDDGLFTFTTILPLGSGIKSSSGSAKVYGSSKECHSHRECHWKVISFIPQKVLYASSRSLLLKLSILAGVLFILSGISSWIMAQALVKRKMYHEDLWHSANHDILTGLPNRLMFQEKLRQTLLEATRYKHHFAVLYIDLDGFKSVNDTIGHDGGDQFLLETSKRLTGCLRESDMASRVGGDEFTVILPKISSPKHAEVVAGNILNKFSEPISLKSTRKTINASIGIAVFPDDGTEIKTILKNADTAMYKAKSSVQKRYAFFNAN